MMLCSHLVFKCVNQALELLFYIERLLHVLVYFCGILSVCCRLAGVDRHFWLKNKFYLMELLYHESPSLE